MLAVYILLVRLVMLSVRKLKNQATLQMPINMTTTGPHHPLQRQSSSHVSASSVPTKPLHVLFSLFSPGIDSQHLIKVIAK